MRTYRVRSLIFQMNWKYYLFSFLCQIGAAEYLAAPHSFLEAKRILKKTPSPAFDKTFFCSASIDYEHLSLGDCPSSVDKQSCTLQWDHLVPASRLGRNLPCWLAPTCPWDPNASHRQCCQKFSLEFQYREAFLYNLVPVVAALNRLKSNYMPGVVSLKKRTRALCGLKVDPKQKIFEPPDFRKGWVARVYLKVDAIYDLALSKSQKELLKYWDQTYPPDQDEKKHLEYLNKFYELSQNTL